MKARESKAAENIFDSLLSEQKNRKFPPVSSWHPKLVSESGMKIDRKGNWYYLDSPIRRIPMVKLFASVLRFEDNTFYLVMPHEKLRIEVEDVPFLVTDFHLRDAGKQNQSILMSTNLNEHIVVSRQHPLELIHYQNNPLPYLTVREGIRARLNRNTYYRLFDHLTFGTDQQKGPLGVWSQGTFFRMEPEQV